MGLVKDVCRTTPGVADSELESTPLAKLMFHLAAEKGASACLTALPLKEYGYLMNKQQFSDAIALRYNLNLKDCPKTCV